MSIQCPNAQADTKSGAENNKRRGGVTQHGKAVPRVSLCAFLWALAGALLSLYGAFFKAEALCITAGCELLQGFGGVESFFWWLGAGTFAFAAFLCARNSAKLVALLASLCLAADCVLLGVMAYTVPCVPCLSVALCFLGLFVCTTGGAWRNSGDLGGSAENAQQIGKYEKFPLESVGRVGRFVFLALWLMLFSPNALHAVQENVGGWCLYGSKTAALKVFFSPSCPACREAVLALGEKPNKNIAFYPVAKNDNDITSLNTMEEEIAGGSSMSAAFLIAVNDPVLQARSVPFWRKISLQLRTLQNQALLMRLGVHSLPALVSSGVPKAFLPQRSPRTDGATLFSPQMKRAKQWERENQENQAQQKNRVNQVYGSGQNDSAPELFIDISPDIFSDDGFAGCSNANPAPCPENLGNGM